MLEMHIILFSDDALTGCSLDHFDDAASQGREGNSSPGIGQIKGFEVELSINHSISLCALLSIISIIYTY